MTAFPTDAEVGELVRRGRVALGLSQYDLARILDTLDLPMHQQTILKIEKGRRSLKFREAQALRLVLGADAFSATDEASVNILGSDGVWHAGFKAGVRAAAKAAAEAVAS